MKTNNMMMMHSGFYMMATGAACLLLAACASNAVQDPGAARVRAELTGLQANSDLSNRAPVAMQDAEAAVKAAEQPQADRKAGAHLVYIADRKVQIAQAQAQTRFIEDQRAALSETNANMQLDARTQEADTAKRKSAALQTETDYANRKSAALQTETDDANRKSTTLQAQTDSADRENAALQAQITELRARKTDAGLVMTLGDVLFSSGRSDLKPGATANLDRLVTFLGQAPDRSVRIEGHTDNVGSESLNQTLSQKRAESVAAYLMTRGVANARVTAVGQGYTSPVADNSSPAGRQANRRVEIIIQNPSPPSGS